MFGSYKSFVSLHDSVNENAVPLWEIDDDFDCQRLLFPTRTPAYMKEMSGLRSPSPPWSRRNHGRNYRIFAVIAASVLFFTLFLYSPLPTSYDHRRDIIIQKLADVTAERMGTPESNSRSSHIPHHPPSLATTNSKYAFATFLGRSEDDFNHDKYFKATRILAYQLLHAEETRTLTGIPFVVLVSPEVTQDKRQRLRMDGAIVLEAPKIDAGWMHTDVWTWQEMLTKLRLWELTQFERILFMDGDTVLTKPMDSIFDDPATQIRASGENQDQIREDEASLPKNFLFAAFQEMNHEHSYPPVDTETQHDYPNINCKWT